MGFIKFLPGGGNSRSKVGHIPDAAPGPRPLLECVLSMPGMLPAAPSQGRECFQGAISRHGALGEPGAAFPRDKASAEPS